MDSVNIKRIVTVDEISQLVNKMIYSMLDYRAPYGYVAKENDNTTTIEPATETEGGFIYKYSLEINDETGEPTGRRLYKYNNGSTIEEKVFTEVKENEIPTGKWSNDEKLILNNLVKAEDGYILASSADINGIF